MNIVDKNKKMHPVARYFLNVALAVDQLGNAFWGGDEDETISSRLGKMERREKQGLKRMRLIPRFLKNALNMIDKDHCEEAIEHDEGKNSVFDRGL